MIETTVDGRYQIAGRIASGGMGEVFLAHDPVLERDIALKVLHRTLAGDADFIDRFRREARAAGMLSHPNIVAVHDWGQAGDTYFMVMEFVRGPNLRTLLTRGGPVQPAQAAEIVSQTLAALGHAHAQGIVHRDVKPENILISPEGVVKVADFGLARALAESRVTHAPGTVTGTVQYLSPEQIQGEPADPRTDLYATGIVLYEMLVGRVPFSGETSVAIAYKHLRERVPPPSKANPMVPASLDRVVGEATEKDRERRVRSAEDMRRRLARSAAELPPAPSLAALAATAPTKNEVPPDRAPTVTIPRAPSKRETRGRLARRVAGALLLVALLVAGGWAAWEFLVPHRTDVPRVVGLTVERAQARADEAGLEIDATRSEFSSEVEAGHIVAQEPPPGDQADEGSAIAVVVSLGPELVDAPDVVGIQTPKAKAALREAGLVPDAVRAYHDQVPAGRVIEQSPKAGASIEVGEAVEIVVSRGPEPVTVLDVRGRTEADARALLEGTGLVVETVQGFSDTRPRGDVIRQAPKAGAAVPPGSTIKLVISQGPREFDMPNVKGMSSAEATATLEGLGLDVRLVQLPNAGDAVVSQEPGPGATVRAGDEVTIYIGG